MNIQDVFIGRARKFNRYIEGEHKENQSCRTCVRKHFSFPYTCNDGWPMGDPNWIDKGATCINWSDNANCQID